MPFSTAQRLQSLGVATPLARELGNQLDTGVFNYKRLMWSGMPVQLAQLVAGGNFDPKKATELGMIPSVAKLVSGAAPPPMPAYKAAVARVKNGVSREIILCVGDSTTWGTGAGTGPELTAGARVKAYPYKLSAKLAARGVPSQQEGSFGDSNRFSELSAYDPRQLNGAGWSSSGSTTTIGGNARSNSTDTTPISITPATAVDTFRFWVLQATSVADVACDVDGSVSTVFNSRVAPTALKSFEKASALGVHTFNFSRSGGVGTAYLFGFNAFNSAEKKMDIFNAGWSGSTSAQNVSGSNPWNPLQAIAYLSPSLTIINNTLNDMITGSVDLATRQANIQLQINAAKIGGDVVLVAPNPVSTGTVSQSVQNANRDMIRSLAASNGVRFVDLLSAFGGSYNAANSSGLMGDVIHPNEAGYELAATVLDNLLAI